MADNQDYVDSNVNNGPEQSFAQQMFGVEDPSQILVPDGVSKTDPNKMRYRFAGDGKIYTASKDKDLNQVLESIWNQKSPGLLGSIGATTWYGLPADGASALAYALNAAGLDESAQGWRQYADKNREEFNQKYGQYMVPTAQAAWDQGKMLDYAMQTIGSGAPYIGLALAGGFAGGAAGGALGGAGAAAEGVSLATQMGAFLGSTAVMSPITIAQFADRQIAEMRQAGVEDPENNIDWPSALGMGIAASGMQALPVESILYGGPLLGALKGMGVELGSRASSKILAHTADVAGTNALVGLGTSVLSRAQADMPMLDSQAQVEYFDAAIAGSLVGLPFGIGRGIYSRGKNFEAPTNKGINDIIDENSQPISTPPVTTQEGGPSKYDYVFFNDHMDYGIKDVYQAQEYMQSVKYRKNGVDHNAFDDFRSGEMYGPNFTDEQLIQNARRVAFIRGKNDLVGGSKNGILFTNIEELPQVHSNDPKVLTRAAFLTDKVGYLDAQVRRLSDATINKLYETHIKRAIKDPNMAKPILDHIDPEIVEAVKNYGSLAQRPEAKERILNNARTNDKILRGNFREKLAKELMDKQARMNEGKTREPLKRLPPPMWEANRFGQAPDDVAYAERQRPSVIPDEVNPELIRQHQEEIARLEDEGGKPWSRPVQEIADAIVNPQPKIPPKELANFLAGQEMFQKLAQTDDVAKEILSKVRRMNSPGKEPKIRAEPEPKGLLSRGNRTLDTSPDPRDVLAEQRQFLRGVATGELERMHPGLAKGLNDLAKALAETMPKTNLLDEGKKNPDTTMTKAVRQSPLLDVLAKRQAVINTLTNAFKGISDKNSKFFGDLFTRLANNNELSITDLKNLTTVFNTAFGIRHKIANVEPLLMQDLYKEIRSKLSAKDQMMYDRESTNLIKWYQKSHGINPKDLAKFTPADIEAVAFDNFLRGELGFRQDFRNSKHDKLFRSLDNTFKRIQKELNDQGLRNIDHIFAANNTNENVPPGAKPNVTQAINDEVVRGPMKAANDKIISDFKDKTEQEITDTPNNVAFRPVNDTDTLGGVANNIGTPTLYLNKLLSIPAKSRQIPAFAKLFVSRQWQERKAAEYQFRMSNKVSDIQHKYGNAKFSEAADFLAHMRKTEQSLKLNDAGQVEVTNKDGAKVALSREFSNMLRDVNSVFKEAPKIAREIYQRDLNYFDEEGLNENTSVEGIGRAIDKLDGAIKGNPLDEQRSRLVSRRQLLKSIRDRIREFDQVINEDKPYVPFMRFGDYMVQVVDKTKKDSDGKFETVHFEPLNDSNIFGLKTKLPGEKEARQKIEQLGLNKKYGDKSRYEIRHFQMTYDNANKYINRNLITHELVQSLISNGLNDSLSAADLIAQTAAGIDPKEAGEVLGNIKTLIRQDENRVMRILNARGMGRFAVESQNIDGHSKDWGRVAEAYTNIFANSLARRENAREWSKHVANIELEQNIPESVRKELRDYVSYVTDPGGDWGGMRAFNYVMAMGFRPMSAILQFFTLPQQVVGGMTEYSPNIAWNATLVAKNFAKSLIHNGYKVANKDSPVYSSEIKELLAKHKADLRGTIKKDTLLDFGLSGRPMEKAAHRIIDTAGLMLTGAEQVTREAGFVSYYEQLGAKSILDRAVDQRKNDQLWQAYWAKNSKDMSLREAMAIYTTLENHAHFGKIGRGPLQKGMLGSVFFPFTTYGQQMLEVLGGQLSGKRGFHGLLGGLWTMSSYLALAGMAGIPAWDLWKTMIEEWEKKVNNRTMDVEMWLKEQGMPVWARKGILSQATGWDLSNRLSQNVVAQNIMEGLIKGDVKFNDLFGVAGNTARGALSGIEELFNPMSTTESSIKAAMPMLPAALQDLIKASMMATNPGSQILQTATGKQLQNQPSANDILGQVLGATPLNRTLEREKVYWEQKVNQEFNQFKSRLAENLAQAQFMIMNGNETEGNQLKAAMQRELLAYARANNMVITPEFWSGMNKAIMNRLQQKVGIQSKPTMQQLRHGKALYSNE